MCVHLHQEKRYQESDHTTMPQSSKVEVTRDDPVLDNLGLLTEGLIFHAKNFVLPVGNEKQWEASTKERAVICRKIAPVKRLEAEEWQTKETNLRQWNVYYVIYPFSDLLIEWVSQWSQGPYIQTEGFLTSHEAGESSCVPIYGSSGVRQWPGFTFWCRLWLPLCRILGECRNTSPIRASDQGHTKTTGHLGGRVIWLSFKPIMEVEGW